MGHSSDAVDFYQMTGHDQPQLISSVVQGRIQHVNEREDFQSKPKSDVMVNVKDNKEGAGDDTQ